MKKAIQINNLSVKKNNKLLLQNISLTFFQGVSCFLCGTSGSGKTLLLEAIANKIKYEGHIDTFSKVVVLFDKLSFTSNSVEDELKYLSLNSVQQQFISNFFDENKLSSSPNDLSFKEKKILILCSLLCKNPQIVFIDNLFSFLDDDTIKKFDTYFKKNKITVVLVSTNIEEALKYKYMIVMNDGMVAIEGQTEQVLKEEKILKRLGIGLPFYVDLSIQLKYYNLIDEIYLTKEELTDKLWK